MRGLGFLEGVEGVCFLLYVCMYVCKRRKL